jgi:hypothetical protein
MNEDERGNWYLITGLILGILLGVLYSKVIQPVQYTDTSPSSLLEEYKEKYRILVASAYEANGDLVRAKARLGLLKDENSYRIVAEQAQKMLADGCSAEEARALGILAVALGEELPTVEPIQTLIPTPTK